MGRVLGEILDNHITITKLPDLCKIPWDIKYLGLNYSALLPYFYPIIIYYKRQGNKQVFKIAIKMSSIVDKVLVDKKNYKQDKYSQVCFVFNNI